MDATTLAAQITQTKTQLDALNTAINARLDPTTASYSLDTSQSNQSWSGWSIDKLLKAQDALMNRLCVLQQRQSKRGTLGVPAW